MSLLPYYFVIEYIIIEALICSRHCFKQSRFRNIIILFDFITISSYAFYFLTIDCLLSKISVSCSMLFLAHSILPHNTYSMNIL